MHPQQSLHSGRLLRRTDFASSSANRKGHSRLGKFLKGPHCRRASAPLRRLYYWDRHHRTLVRPAVCEASTGTGDGTLSGGNQTGDSIGTPPDGQFMSSASTPGSENRSTFGTLIERLGALLEMRTVGVDAEAYFVGGALALGLGLLAGRTLLGNSPRPNAPALASSVAAVVAHPNSPPLPSFGTNGNGDSRRTTQPWTRVSSTGSVSSLFADKFAVAHRYQLPFRDVHLLEPTTYSSALLARPHVILVSVEQFRVLINAEEILLPGDPQSEYSAWFLAKLQERLHSVDPVSQASPFELSCLEVVLDSVSTKLLQNADTVERELRPTLEAITQRVNGDNLARMRRVKGRLLRAVNKIAAVRSEVSRLLDDDAAVRQMCLSYRANAASQAAAAAAAAESGDGGHRAEEHHQQGGGSAAGAAGASAAGFEAGSEGDVELMAEMLESYFSKLDDGYRKLLLAQEMVGDTEDFIQISLSSRRTNLIFASLIIGALSISDRRLRIVAGVILSVTVLVGLE